MVRVLLAADKFKGTLTASQVAEHLATGLARGRPDAEVTTVAVADGGDGLLDAAEQAGFEAVPVSAEDASGAIRRTRFVRRGHEAVVELAEVCGLSLYGDGALDPLGAGTRGVGQVLTAALDAGCTTLVLGVGGSASTDGGAGMAQALGVRVLDPGGAVLPDGGAALLGAAQIDLAGRDPRLTAIELTVACDVTNPLTGPHGAAAVYGPQKGADAGQVELLDRALTRWADVLAQAVGTDHRDAPGAGAAGGVAFGALALLGARVRPGADVVFELTGFTDALAGADLVVTGEGSLDEQTLHGKAPARVAEQARARGVPVVAVAGRLALSPDQLSRAGFAASYTLLEEADAETAMRDPGPLLERIGERLAADVPTLVGSR